MRSGARNLFRSEVTSLPRLEARPYRLDVGQVGSLTGASDLGVRSLRQVIPTAGVPVTHTFQVGDAQRAAPLTVSLRLPSCVSANGEAIDHDQRRMSLQLL